MSDSEPDPETPHAELGERGGKRATAGDPPPDQHELGDSDRISTGCTAIDELLGGGLERGTATQVYGAPASGKTNLALSAAVAVASAGGMALYIDTEGLSADRFRQLLAAETDDVDTVAERIVVADALDFDDQAEAVRDAAEIAARLDLIVLDSATGFYRLQRDDADEGDALRRVTRQVTHLLSLARRHDLSVLLTNQVYTDPESEGNTAKPLGGHTLAHWTAVVLRLDRFRGGRRRATLRKHQSQPAGETAEFRITESGLESGR